MAAVRAAPRLSLIAALKVIPALVALAVKWDHQEATNVCQAEKVALNQRSTVEPRAMDAQATSVVR